MFLAAGWRFWAAAGHTLSFKATAKVTQARRQRNGLRKLAAARKLRLIALEQGRCARQSASVKALLAIVALVALSGAAAGQRAAAPPKQAKAAHGYAHPARSIVIPETMAPPQEAFASLPDKESANTTAPTDCDLQLAKVAGFRPLGALVAPGECGAPDAVEIESVLLPGGAKVTIAPPATLRCTMATAVAQWVRDDIAPAAMKLGAPLREIENLGSYECRGRDRVRGATLSEHGRANALDVHAFKLANGMRIVLADPRAPVDFRNSVREAACARFATVLGPGSDSDHARHVHLDLAPRRNNYKICEWDVRAPAAVAEGTPIASDDVPLPRPRPLLANTSSR